MTDFKSPPPTSLDQNSNSEYQAIKNSEFAILCGRNNSGKSFLLRKLVRDIGRSASYLGPARYQNFILLNAYNPSNDRKKQKWDNLIRHISKDQQNVDNSPLNLSQAVAELTDDKRKVLFDLLDKLLGTETAIQHTVPNNTMSQKYVNVDGYNLAFTSSGFRLVATLLTSLLDDDYNQFLIDEPELGLSPEIQGILSDFLLDPEERNKYFPHIESIILATHSPIFLDRMNISNNYFISRTDTDIQIKQLSNVQDINSLQFFLLGNRFETLFLPSAIVLVEGKCDYQYLNRLIGIKYPESLISVIQCNSDSRIKEVVNIAKQMLHDIQKSPYSNRILAVLDSVHGQGLTQQLEGMGIKKSNIIVWDSNGIEYVYPKSILEKKFGSYSQLTINEDIVSANGVDIKKSDLTQFVVQNLTPSTNLPEELESKFLKKLNEILY